MANTSEETLYIRLNIGTELILAECPNGRVV